MDKLIRGDRIFVCVIYKNETEIRYQQHFENAQVHYPEEKFRDPMSIRLTRFPRTCVDDSLCLHGGKRISMSMEKSEKEKRGVNGEESRTCHPWKLVEEVTQDDERLARGSWTEGRRRYGGELKGGDKAVWGQGGKAGGRGDGGGVGVPGWGCVELIIFRCLSWRPQT